MKIRAVALALVAALSATAEAQTCPGDCNGDGTVTVDEIVLAVNIALGVQQVSQCANADRNASGMVEVDEIIQAVNAALCGCGQGCPTPTPTPFFPTPTATPGLDLAAVIQSAALSTVPGATSIAAFILAPGSAARESGAGAGGTQTRNCPAGGTASSFCINTGGTSTFTADLASCAIQLGGVEYRASGRVAAIQPVGCDAQLPPNSSLSVNFTLGIVVIDQSTSSSVNVSTSQAGEIRFRTDGSVSSGLAGAAQTLCGQGVSTRSITFLVTPAGSICPTSGDMRVTLTGTTIPNKVQFGPQGANIDIGEDGTIDRANVPCGPPPPLICP
jgi:hypothetical protein